MFFQTIIGNSSLSDYVSDNVTYADWLPRTIHPLFLTDRHIDALEAHLHQTELLPGHQELLFARKFSSDRPDLLDRIDQDLRSNSLEAKMRFGSF